MGQFVIAAYRPKSGKAAELLQVVREHRGVLLAQKLITDRQTHVMRAGDGTIVEVFEWVSAAASSQAHENAAVGALWARFDACCDFVPLQGLAEFEGPFAEFEAVAP